jgi:(p)ppGpp synthase/HD superfamily hydrolase
MIDFRNFPVRTPHTLESSALAFAVAAHGGQVRKGTGAPYAIHLIRVAELVRTVAKAPKPTQIAAAYLHDTVEDSLVTLGDIADRFGSEVATLVKYLSDISKPSDGNRAARKAIDRAHFAQGPADAKTVKLADLIDNSHDIVANMPDFAPKFLHEKALLLEVLGDGDAALMTLARSTLSEGLAAVDARRQALNPNIATALAGFSAGSAF